MAPEKRDRQGMKRRTDREKEMLLGCCTRSSPRPRARTCTSPAVDRWDPSREGRPPDTTSRGASRPAGVVVHRHWRHPQRQVEEGKPASGSRGRGVKRHTGRLLVGPRRRRRRSHLVALLERQPLVGDVAERRGDDDDRPRSDERAGHAATDNLALPRGQEGGEAGGPRGRGRRQEGAGEGEDLEPALERGDRRRRGRRARLGRLRLAQRDVGHGPGRRENADAALPAARVGGERLEDVAAGGDLEDVRAERVGALPGDDHGRLGLVLGPRRAAARAARDDVPAADARASGGAGRTPTAARSRRQRVLAIVGAPRGAAAVFVLEVEGQ
jgi:hypothetical protein